MNAGEQHVVVRVRSETAACLKQANAILDAAGDQDPKALMRCVKLLANELFRASIETVEIPIGLSDTFSSDLDDVTARAMDLESGA